MELIVQRKDLTDRCAIGQLMVNGVFCCFTLEDPVSDGPKVPAQTAIPPGRYRVIITPSVRFGRLLPLLCEVPGFSGVRIHPGNTAADTSGCILVGLRRTTSTIERSREAMAFLQPKIVEALLRGESVWMTVQNPERIEA